MSEATMAFAPGSQAWGCTREETADMSLDGPLFCETLVSCCLASESNRWSSCCRGGL